MFLRLYAGFCKWIVAFNEENTEREHGVKCY